MKANELRIGNIALRFLGVLDSCAQYQFVKIVGVSEFSADVFIIRPETEFDISSPGYAKVSISELQPIPLTEKWLIRAGFEKINHRTEGIIFKKDWLRCTSTLTGWDWRGGYIPNTPQFIHQLQNLYFALTGQELEFKNEPQ